MRAGACPYPVEFNSGSIVNDDHPGLKGIRDPPGDEQRVPLGRRVVEIPEAEHAEVRLGPRFIADAVRCHGSEWSARSRCRRLRTRAPHRAEQ